MKKSFITIITILLILCINESTLTVHAANRYGIPDTEISKMDELLMDFIEENVPEEAILENDSLTAFGNMAIWEGRGSTSPINGYCFSYTDGDAYKQVIIFDCKTTDRVYRADRFWVQMSAVQIIDLSGQMYAYEDGEWKYIKHVDPYLRKNSSGSNDSPGSHGWRLFVSGAQWENNYRQSRLLIALETDRTWALSHGAGTWYRPVIQIKHHNTIWLGNYPIEFYWSEAFKVVLIIGCLCAVFAIFITKRRKKRHLQDLISEIRQET